MTQPNKAFIFDMNGTMIDDMKYHTEIWYEMLNKDLGASMTYEQVKLQMYGKNEELLERVFGKSRFTPEEMNHYVIEKEKRYQKLYRPHMKLIDGLDIFFKEAANQNIPMSIGSAAGVFNVDYILDNLNLRHYFKCIVCAEDVKESKPHPETFLLAANSMGVEPENCIVFEDAPKGVECAQNAGMKCVVLTTAHEAKDFEKYDNLLAIVKDYTDPCLKALTV
ncbi:HAD family phosphatase [Cytophagaceae bacterium ABcell3]|nr:HAD family phosphatase [Cytophagaceae bacterium ABcell3]